MKLGAEHGWKRILLHFLSWGGAASIGLYIAFKAGLDYSSYPMWSAFTFALLLAGLTEIRSTVRKKQTAGKMVIDFLTKVAGLGVAFGSAGWWWK